MDGVGREQANAAAAALARRAPALLLSSDSTRAASTLAGLAERSGLDPTLDAALREIDLGRWQGLNRAQVQASYPVEYDEWLTGDDVRRGGGETFAEVGKRAVARLQAALLDVPPGGLLVACTHGGTTRAVLGVLLETASAHWWRLGPLGNARWSTVMETPRGWRLLEHNAGVEEPTLEVAHAADVEAAEGEQPVQPAAEGRAARVL